MAKQDIQIFNIDFLTIFKLEEDYPLAIPPYQRSYVWDNEKLEDLVSDLIEFLDTTSHGKYYLGTVMLHRHDDTERGAVLDIIDGQQRITTLCILHYILKNCLPKKSLLAYNSLQSKSNIRLAHQYLKTIDASEICAYSNLFERLEFTVIITTSQDDAFAFFDTQNNRGIKPGAIEVLKAYHIREIQEDPSLQEMSARKWEKIQNEKLMEHLLFSVLWRARTWKGQKIYNYESDDKMIELEFKKRTLPSLANNRIPAYSHPKNRRALYMEWNYESNNITYSKSDDEEQYMEYPPFSIRQPINKGLGFFLYIDNYAGILRDIRRGKCYQNGSYFDYYYFYDDSGSYLAHLFELCLIVYYDKFRTEDLFEFSVWLDYALGSIRVYNYSIRKQAPKNFVNEHPLNIIDAIANSYTTQEILLYLKGLKLDKMYSVAVSEFKPARTRYYNKQLQFFKVQDTGFIRKKQWIAKLLNSSRS